MSFGLKFVSKQKFDNWSSFSSVLIKTDLNLSWTQVSLKFQHEFWNNLSLSMKNLKENVFGLKKSRIYENIFVRMEVQDNRMNYGGLGANENDKLSQGATFLCAIIPSSYKETNISRKCLNKRFEFRAFASWVSLNFIFIV